MNKRNYWNIDTTVYQLIGAAPDLLKALQGLVDCFDEHGVFETPDDIAARWDEARAAIDKATKGTRK